MTVPHPRVDRQVLLYNGRLRLVMQEVLRVERLVPEALRAEGPNGRPGTGQLGIPAVRSALINH
jgi:hypothetical protein